MRAMQLIQLSQCNSISPAVYVYEYVPLIIHNYSRYISHKIDHKDLSVNAHGQTDDATKCSNKNVVDNNDVCYKKGNSSSYVDSFLPQ